MMKTKRKKIQREWLENQLAKYERRIQRLAEEAYHIRQAIKAAIVVPINHPRLIFIISSL